MRRNLPVADAGRVLGGFVSALPSGTLLERPGTPMSNALWRVQPRIRRSGQGGPIDVFARQSFFGHKYSHELLYNPIGTRLMNYLVHHGRVVDLSDARPLTSRLVRHILKIELPFVDGIGLADFSRITVDEFNSYSGFRNFLRRSLLNVDDARNDTQSEQALATIETEVDDEVRKIGTEMNSIIRKRRIAVTGAAVGTVGALLVPVYGPAFQEAIAAVGATVGSGALSQCHVEEHDRNFGSTVVPTVGAAGVVDAE